MSRDQQIALWLIEVLLDFGEAYHQDRRVAHRAAPFAANMIQATLLPMPPELATNLIESAIALVPNLPLDTEPQPR